MGLPVFPQRLASIALVPIVLLNRRTIKAAFPSGGRVTIGPRCPRSQEDASDACRLPRTGGGQPAKGAHWSRGVICVPAYGMSKRVDLSFAEAVEKITALLKEQGFGVLTTIDVKATMKDKLGVEGEPYVILGACNPQLAHRALSVETDIGLLLPCNVIVYEKEGQTTVAVLDPEAAMSVAANGGLTDVASEAKSRLKRALGAI